MEKDLNYKKMLLDEIIKKNTFLKVNEVSLTKYKKIMQEEYSNDSFPSIEIIEWLNKGKKLHENSKRECQFCENYFDYNKISAKIDEINSNKQKEDLFFLKEFKLCLNEFKDWITKLIQKKDEISSIIVLDDSISFLNLINNLEKQIKLIDYKTNNFKHSFQIDKDELNSSLKETESIKNNIEFQINEEIKKDEYQLNKINALIKGSIGLSIKKSSFINTKKEEFINIENEIKNINLKNKEIQEEIKIWKDKETNKTDFANLLNENLEKLNIDFKFELVSNNYIIKHRFENEKLSLKDISEGEKRLLAFLYFYFELFKDKEQKILKEEIEIIIVDDPISSLDNDNILFIHVFLKNIMSKYNFLQIFILTHNWNDFSELIYGYERKEKDISCFEVKKEKNSFIKKINISNIKNPYKHQFKEIFDFSKKKEIDIENECEIYHYPNVIRKILEEFLSFKISKKCSVSEQNYETILKVLCGKTPSPSNQKLVHELIKVCNIGSHKHFRNTSEILRVAQFLMDRIQYIDEAHHHYNSSS